MDADTGDELYSKMPMTCYPAVRRNHDAILGIELGKEQAMMDKPLHITDDIYDIDSDARSSESSPAIKSPSVMPDRHDARIGCDAAVASPKRYADGSRFCR